MTPKTRRFIQEYIVDLNGTLAAIRAGFAENGAGVTANRLLKNPIVREEIKILQGKLALTTEITATRVLNELAKLGFANMQDYIKTTPEGEFYTDFSALSRDQAAAIIEITCETYMDGRGDEARAVKRTKFKLADKRAALCDIGKHLGMFIDVNLNLNADYKLADTLPDEDEWKRQHAVIAATETGVVNVDRGKAN